MTCPRFWGAKDVAEYMGIAESTAYKIIKKLNKELEDQGYITVAGKVSRKYFEERVYGFDEDDEA